MLEDAQPGDIASPHTDQIANRVLEQCALPIWEGGPTFKALMSRFVATCAEEAQLDAWIPFSNPHVRETFMWFFQGAAYRLGDLLAVHSKTAGVGLVFACLQNFEGFADPDVLTKLALGMVPALDGRSEEVFHGLGARTVERWFAVGLQSKPNVDSFVNLKEVFEKHAHPEVLDPHGLAGKVVELFTKTKN